MVMSPLLRPGRAVFVAITVIVVAVDTGSKAFASSTRTVVVNHGVAFGMGGGRPVLAAVVSSIVTLAAIGLGWRWCTGPPRGFGWGLVAGGALGNAVGRVASPHHGVVDWITIPVYPATFNLADVAIRVGAVLLLADWVVASRRTSLAG